MCYFGDRGIPTACARSLGLATVPTQWPEEFDLTAEPSDRYWRFPRRQDDDPYMKARVSAMFDKLTRSADPGPDRGARRAKPQTRRDAEQDVASGFAHLQSPIAPSPRLRAALGLLDEDAA